MNEDKKRTAREAFARAERMDRDLLRRFPRAWDEMDRMRTHPPQPWPDWCLVPMAAATAVGTEFAPMETLRVQIEQPPIAQIAAAYAWRYSRSVYLVHPHLRERLVGTVPDLPDLELLAGMPDWCLYLPEALSDGADLWAHLEHDINTGRPELRLMVFWGGRHYPIPVYLDRATVTEAVADFLATARATGDVGERYRTGRDVHGGALDPVIGQIADEVDSMIALVSYLCRPEADIQELGRPGVSPPPRARRARSGRTTWLVGYGG